MTIDIKAVLSNLNPTVATALEEHFVALGEANAQKQKAQGLIDNLDQQLQSRGINLAQLGIKLKVENQVRLGRPPKGEPSKTDRIRALFDANPNISAKEILAKLSEEGVSTTPNTIHTTISKYRKELAQKVQATEVQPETQPAVQPAAE